MNCQKLPNLNFPYLTLFANNQEKGINVHDFLWQIPSLPV